MWSSALIDPGDRCTNLTFTFVGEKQAGLHVAPVGGKTMLIVTAFEWVASTGVPN